MSGTARAAPGRTSGFQQPGEELVERAIAEAQGRPDVLGQALATGAVIDLPAGNLARAERRFRYASRLLEQAGDPHGSARLLYWQAMASYVAAGPQEALATALSSGTPLTCYEASWGAR